MVGRSLLPWTRSNMPVRGEDGLLPFSQIERLFDDFMSGFDMPLMRSMQSQTFVPALDIRENEKGIEVSVELPGMDEKDIDISVTREALVVSGEKRYEREENEKDRGLYRLERRYGSFKRSLALPEGIDVDKAEARFKNGVLTVHLPKSENYRQQVRKLQVRSDSGEKSDGQSSS